jgi:hypothetical protein
VSLYHKKKNFLIAGLPEFYCGSNEPSHAFQFKWLENTFNPFAPAAKSLSDRPENLHLGWKKIKNKNTF